jgi:hypothetical protein
MSIRKWLLGSLGAAAVGLALSAGIAYARTSR